MRPAPSARAWLGLALWLLAATSTADEHAMRVQITDPYIELRTHVGEAYPVFHVADRGTWVEILRRHTDWFRIRTERGTEGWVHRAQLERTLTEAGVATSFRDILLEDFLRRRLELGMAGGTVSSDPAMAVRLGYVLHPNFTVELGLTQASGSFSSTTLYHLNLLSQPLPDGRFVPYFTLGVGRFENTPRGTLVNARASDALAINAGVGVRFYINRRFVVRGDFKDYLVLVGDNRSEELREWLIGLSFFF